MIAVRGTFDGKTIRPVSEASLPTVDEEVEVIITFPDGVEPPKAPSDGASALELFRRLREQMQPLDFPVKDLVEHEREC